jgi:RHS repeat-associated protein
MSNTLDINDVQSYDPYGNPESHYGAGFGFTGEQTDENGQLYLRARYYNPALGVFPSLDPFEGLFDQPMSLNGYAWVEGNPINLTDASGMCPENPWPNDFPGQRCVWLANELHEKYGFSLTLLMQKDILELESIYALGNLKGTFYDSSWSQTVRNNPGAALVIAGGAILGTGAIIGTGGAATPAVLAITGTATLGGIGGAAVGTGYGLTMYQIAISGQCGCAIQQQTLAIGEERFIAYARENAALHGTAYSGLIASGPAGQLTAGIGGGIQAGQTLYETGKDISSNGLNVCNTINGLLGVAGVIFGVKTTQGAYNNYQVLRTQPSQTQPLLPVGRSDLRTLPQSSNGIIISTQYGTTIRIPNGWIGRTANNGKGLVFQRSGAVGDADSIRIMDPTTAYPYGYVRYYNSFGQPLDAFGKPGSRAATHIPLNYNGQISGWPYE